MIYACFLLDTFLACIFILKMELLLLNDRLLQTVFGLVNEFIGVHFTIHCYVHTLVLSVALFTNFLW
jgi:hypothetical protein